MSKLRALSCARAAERQKWSAADGAAARGNLDGMKKRTPVSESNKRPALQICLFSMRNLLHIELCNLLALANTPSIKNCRLGMSHAETPMAAACRMPSAPAAGN